MSVTTTGAFTLEPFLNPGPGEPLGTLVGAGSSAGDGTGGSNAITWNLGDFVYVLRGLSAGHNSSTDKVLNLRFNTGYQVGGFDETLGKTATATAITGLTTFIEWTPPSIFIQPRDATVEISAQMGNVNLITLVAAFRALVFPQNILQVADPSILAQFIV